MDNSVINENPEVWIVNNPSFCSDEINPMLAVSPWSGHRNFAYDLISFIRPARVVELGTHYGCSLFSFLQASKDFGLATEYFAVDTWVGEEHAGFYGEEVFDIVKKTVDSCFPKQYVQMLRKTFDEALGDVPESSVNLLHIDGFHSYDAVKHDYSTWFSRLAENGIVLFHDIAPSAGYGSAIFWAELKNKYPSFEFVDHSFGLGVLFPKGGASYAILSRHLDSKLLDLYKYKAEFDLISRQYSDAQLQLEKRWSIMQSMEEMIRDRDEVIIGQQKLLQKLSTTPGAMRVLLSALKGSFQQIIGRILGAR